MNIHSFPGSASQHSGGTNAYIYCCKLLLVFLLLEATQTYGQSTGPQSIQPMNTVERRAHAFDMVPRQLKAIEALYVTLHPGEQINWPDLGGPREWVKREWEQVEPVVVAVLHGEHETIGWQDGALVGRLNPSKLVCDALYTRLQEVYETARGRDGQFTKNDHIDLTAMIPVLALARDVRATAIVHKLIQLDECPTYAMSEYLRALFRIGVLESLDALQTMPLRKTHEGIDHLATSVEQTIERTVPRPPAPPILQRIKVLNASTYVFDFGAAGGPAAPALAEIRNVQGKGADERTAYYYLFGNRQANTRLEPLRWDVNSGMMFCTYSHVLPGTPPMLNRYPIQALVSRPNTVSVLDRSKLGQGSDSPTGLPPPNYIGLGPIGAAYMGIEGWKEGDGLIADGLRASRTGIPVIHYDVRALDDVRVELYMTVNDKLSRWLFDGEKWTLAKNYSATINGPFLVYKEGNAIVAEKDGHWCIIESLDKKNPKIRQIVKRVPDEPLVLVEDLVAGRNYFQQQGKLYNENAAVIWSMPVGLEGNARLKAIVDFVCSRR